MKGFIAGLALAAVAAGATGLVVQNNSNKKIDELNATHQEELNIMQDALDKSEEELNNYKLLLAQQALELDNLKVTLAEKQIELDNLKIKLAEKDAHIAELEEELANNGSLSEEQIASYEAQITSLQNEKATLISEKTALQSEVDTLTAQVAELEAQIETLQARLTELENNQTQTQVAVASVSDFRIEDGYITAYRGNTVTDIVFPSTYSLDGDGNAIDGTDFTIKGLRSSIFFNDSNLQSVVIPDTFTKIGRDCFRNCKNIKYNEYDNGLYIGTETNPYMFLATVKSTDITSIAIHPDTKIIGDAFRECTALTEVTIPEGVTALEDYAFYGCSALTTLSLPNTLERVGRNCFEANSLTYTEYNNGKYLGNTSNPYMVLVTPIDSTATSFVAHENIKIVGGYSGNGFRSSSITSITLPDGLLSIADYTFQECNSLTTINLGNSIKYIGENAFMGAGLTSVNIPASAVDIYRAFYSCRSLTDVTIAEGLEFNAYNTFYNCTALTNISYTRANELDGFGSYQFKDGTLTILSMPDNSDTKAIWTIDNLSSIIKEVKFACTTTFIPKSCFANCSNLTEIILPNSIIEIENGAFTSCTKLTNLTLPDNLQKISVDSAFGAWGSWTTTEYNNAKYLGSEENPYMVLMSVIDKTITEFTVPETTKFIYSSAFSYCTSLTNVVLPEGLMSIGHNAFLSCTALKDITIPSTINLIAITAFGRCDLSSMTLKCVVPPVIYSALSGYHNVKATVVNIPLNTTVVYSVASYWNEAGTLTEISEG